MILKHVQQLKNGNKVLKIEARPDERVITLGLQTHYRLGAQLDMIVPASAIEDMQKVVWCCIEQKWVNI